MLLLMSLGCTVVTTLVFVPALLAIVPGPRDEGRPGALPLDPAKDKSLEPVC